MRAGGFPGNPGGLVVSIVKTAGARAPAHHARGRGRRTWRPTERTAGARMVPPGEGNEARGDGRRGVAMTSWPNPSSVYATHSLSVAASSNTRARARPANHVVNCWRVL